MDSTHIDDLGGVLNDTVIVSFKIDKHIDHYNLTRLKIVDIKKKKEKDLYILAYYARFNVINALMSKTISEVCKDPT